MVESTCFQHTSSYPDKHNNSVDRINSKEEEREDPRRDTSVFFKYSGVSTFYKISSNTVYSTVFPHAIQQLQVSTINSMYRINSSTRNTTTTRLILCRSLQGIFQQLFPVSPSILHGRIRLPATLQHSRPIQH